MQRGLLLVALALLATGVGAAGAPAAATPLRPCGASTSVLCGTVIVPLDRTGQVRGSVGLHVEELRGPSGARSPLLFLVAGGPGQPSASAFDLREYGRALQTFFPGYSLVAYDDRGTGGSGAVSCPGAGAIVTAETAAAKRIVDACARRLGSRAAFYSTRANAEDMDAIRRALGAGRVSLYGVSYGTEQSLVYALLHPANVDRLILDSMAPPAADPFQLASIAALPHALDQLCTGACRAATTHAGADFARLANRVAAHPVVASVPTPGRAPAHVRVDGLHVLLLGVDSDLDSGIAAALPAAVAAALAGNLRPLERLLAVDQTVSAGPGVNAAVGIATECNDGPVPWRRGQTHAQRAVALRRAVRAVPASAFAPFGRWALGASVADACIDWPGAGAATPPRAHRLPVPTLILSGSRDVRTPTAGAREVAAALGRAQLLVVAGSGHDVFDSSACARRDLRTWLAAPHALGPCPAVPFELAPLGPVPQAPAGTARLTAAKTAEIVGETLADAAAIATSYQGLKGRAAGLAGGSLSTDSVDFAELHAYADVPGVTVTGSLGNLNDGPGNWVAGVTVSGARAAAGRVKVLGQRLTGTLGGKQISLRLNE